MLRKLLIAFGLFEIVKPRPVIDACERIGLANPEAAQLRPSALWWTRLEGVVVVWLLVRGRGGSTVVTLLVGLTGIVLALLPRPAITVSQELVYENTDELELQPWIVPAARLLGVCYLLVIALSWRRDGSDESETAVSSQSD